MRSQQQDLAVVSHEDGDNILDESTVHSKVDIGHSIVYKLDHPVQGKLVLFSSTLGSSVIVAV
jgi:hypothetical protein